MAAELEPDDALQSVAVSLHSLHGSKICGCNCDVIGQSYIGNRISSGIQYLPQARLHTSVLFGECT
jgi:hypothetical protein